jgi:hypothetical protein
MPDTQERRHGVAKGHWIRLAALLLMGAIVLVAGRFGPFESQGKSSSQGEAILARLQTAADSGNPDAAAALAAFNNYAAARGLTTTGAADLGQQVKEIAQARGLAVGAQGFAPFWIRLDGSRDFAGLADLQTYRAARALVLDDLALSTPKRSVLVQVSFSARPTPADLLGLVSAYQATIVEMHVDVVRDGARLMTYGSRDDAARAMRGRSADDVVREIRANLADAGLEACGADPATVELAVKFLRLEIPAAEAVKLASAAGIYAVDPLTDVTDEFSTRAVHVDVGAWPNLTESLEQFSGQALVEKPCEATK